MTDDILERAERLLRESDDPPPSAADHLAQIDYIASLAGTHARNARAAMSYGGEGPGTRGHNARLKQIALAAANALREHGEQYGFDRSI